MTRQRDVKQAGALLRLPWFTGLVPNEYVAINGTLAGRRKVSASFEVDRSLTRGKKVSISLSKERSVGVRPRGMSCLVGLVLPGAVVAPICFLAPLEPAQMLLCGRPDVLIVAANLNVFDIVFSLKEEIRKNLTDIFLLFGFDPANPAISPDDDGSQFIKLLALALALAKENLDLDTIGAALEALEKCLRNVQDDAERVRLARQINGLTDLVQTKRIFKNSVLEKTVSGAASPDPDERGGLLERDRQILNRVLRALRTLQRQLRQIERLRRRMVQLEPAAGSAEMDRTFSPSADDLQREIRRLEREFREKLQQFRDEQRREQEALLRLIAAACNEGDLAPILESLRQRMAGLIERNQLLLDILRDTTIPEELAAVNRARGLIGAIKRLIQVEGEKVDRAIAREQEALEDNPRLRAQKLNILLQLRGLINTQEGELLGESGVVLDTNPVTLEDFVREKERSAEAAAEDLKDRERRIEEFRRRLRELFPG